jgi:subtilisin family serine protease
MRIKLMLLLIVPAVGLAQGLGVPSDPNFTGKGAWGQEYDDQWAIKAVGLTAGPESAWHRISSVAAPVVVGVIDTGLDWHHADIAWDNIWNNPGEIADNGIDDDGNGFVDDVIGWDFYANGPKPWDHDGHGTFVSGVIAAAWNDQGIAGINPHAKIMVLKALNNFGHSRASYLSRALVYAADNGADIVNMSVGGEGITDAERAAVEYAVARGVLIVVAAGNSAVDVDTFGIAGLDGVLTVASTDMEGQRAVFSNWGAGVDIAAPGMEVLSLRARRTDLLLGLVDVTYEPGEAYVGDDRRYYRVSGTSFSAPIVTGVASLLKSHNPELTATDIKRILINSALDVGQPGPDNLTGAGIVDAIAALQADPTFFIEVAITAATAVQADDQVFLELQGTLDANQLLRGWLEFGPGENPESWERAGESMLQAVHDGALGRIPAESLRGAPTWTFRLIGENIDGEQREARFVLDVE